MVGTGKLTLGHMVELRVRLADKLVVAARSTRGEPQNEADVAVVERPHGIGVAKQRVHIGRVEERGAGIVEGNGEAFLGLAAEDGEKDRVEVALSNKSE
jgi:hypothetical protein